MQLRRIRVITDEESFERQQNFFYSLKANEIFSVSETSYIAVKQIAPQEWEVIELSNENILRIVEGEVCQKTLLHFSQAEHIYKKSGERFRTYVILG